MMNLTERLSNRKIAINCKTFEETEQLFKILDNWNIVWCYDKDLYYKKDLNWNDYQEETCYTLLGFFDKENGKLSYSDIEYFYGNNFTILSFEKFMEEYNREIEMNKEKNNNAKDWEDILQEIFGDNIKIHSFDLNEDVETNKIKVDKSGDATFKDVETSLANGLENLLESIVRTHSEQDSTKETNLTSKDKYFFKELETAKKAILEAKTLDKKTILFDERERLQGVIIDYCHKKDWSKNIEFTLSDDIMSNGFREEFLNSICKEFGLKYTNALPHLGSKEIIFEIKVN